MRVMLPIRFYENCCLCPRQCGKNRSNTPGQTGPGFCGETDRLKVAYIGPHFGEEPPISGEHGSGTVFLSGCSLRCVFCQNYQISRQGMGTYMSAEEVFRKISGLVNHNHVHNINFVTPDHFLPHVLRVISLCRKSGIDLPVIFNTSGYQSVEMLRAAEAYTDIYLPDFKYSDASLAEILSKCRDYPRMALDAISEMVRQKGFLDTCRTEPKIARKGVLVRHLILPGHPENSINALSALFLEFGRNLPLSLMSQYHPVRHHDNPALNRFLTRKEFYKVYSHALDLGFEYLFVQFPDKNAAREDHPFLPDFRQARPFE